MGIVRLRIKAKEDRGQACLKYMQTRTSPVTLKGWAYGYVVAEREVKEKKAKAPKFKFHDPFNIGDTHATGHASTS